MSRASKTGGKSNSAGRAAIRDDVLVERGSHDGIVRIVLNRPERLNAFDHRMVGRLVDALAGVRFDAGDRVVILTGAGRGFCAGGDIEAMHASGDPADYILELSRRLHAAIHAIVELPQPVIAAVNGPVAGGGLGLALAADIRLAGRSARFSTGHGKLGISPDGGPTYFLPRMVGPAWAAYMTLASVPMDARLAYERGLVVRVCADSRLQKETIELARRLAGLSRLALAQTKRLLRDSWARGLDAQLEAERAGLAVTGRSGRFRGSLASFLRRA